MEFSLEAFTSGFTADPGHGNKRTDEQGLLVEELGQTGTGLAFLCRKVAAVAHDDPLLSDIYYYIRLKDKSQAFFECEFAKIGDLPDSVEFTKGYE